MRNTGLDESQAGINCQENINNLRYADDTTYIAKSEQEGTKEPLDEDERRVKKLA